MPLRLIVLTEKCTRSGKLGCSRCPSHPRGYRDRACRRRGLQRVQRLLQKGCCTPRLRFRVGFIRARCYSFDLYERWRLASRAVGRQGVLHVECATIVRRWATCDRLESSEWDETSSVHCCQHSRAKCCQYQHIFNVLVPTGVRGHYAAQGSATHCKMNEIEHTQVAIVVVPSAACSAAQSAATAAAFRDG